MEDFVDTEKSCEEIGGVLVIDYSDKKRRISDCGLRLKIVFFDMRYRRRFSWNLESRKSFIDSDSVEDVLV